MRKKYGILIAVLLLFFVLLFILTGLFSNRENAGRKEDREKKTELEKEEQSTGRMIETEGFERLESYITSEKAVMLTDAVRAFISDDTRLDEVEMIICEDVFETENKINFYGIFDATDEIVFFAEYDKNSEDLFQYTEEMTQEEAKENWMQKKKEVIETKDWEEEQEMPEEWTYIEEDLRELTIENMDLLSEIISENQQQHFKEELMGFLKENSEYRREFFIQELSLKEAEDHIEFLIEFKTERIDKKIVRSYMDIQTEMWTFELVEGGK